VRRHIGLCPKFQLGDNGTVAIGPRLGPLFGNMGACLLAEGCSFFSSRILPKSSIYGHFSVSHESRGDIIQVLRSLYFSFFLQGRTLRVTSLQQVMEGVRPAE